MNNESLYIVMPAYNESANIENIIEEWHPVVEKISKESRLIIVDDSSKDNTYEILKKLETKFNQLVVLTKANSGHGASCLYLYKYAFQYNPNWIFQTDSDGQTNANEFWEFWKKRNEFNFIIGTRYTRKDGLDRIFVTNVLKIILFFIFGVKIPDANTPFRLMKRDSLERIIKIIPDNSFLSNVLISVTILKIKETNLWLPITFKNRQAGINSINFKKIIKIGFKAIEDFNKFKKKLYEIR
jgi:dolichol-phosphate mannosyltransferase